MVPYFRSAVNYNFRVPCRAPYTSANNTICITAIFPAQKNRHFVSHKKVDIAPTEKLAGTFRRFTEFPIVFSGFFSFFISFKKIIAQIILNINYIIIFNYQELFTFSTDFSTSYFFCIFNCLISFWKIL